MQANPKSGARDRGVAVNIYLDAWTHSRLARLKERWGCSWGQVVKRLLQTPKRRNP